MHDLLQSTPPPRDYPQSREYVDRRGHHFRSFLHCFFRNRRKGMRRGDDRGIGHYVDVHGPLIIICAIAVLILSCADSVLTLLLLQQGAVEVNPLMRLLIDTDTGLFVAVKLAVTAGCVVFIVGHKNFWLFNIRGHVVLYAALAVYILLINYEILLLTS